MRVLFAGGGTGGHLYPAIALARHLRCVQPGAECLFLGSRGGLESSIVPQEGFALRTIPSSGFRRLGWTGRLRFFWSLARGAPAPANPWQATTLEWLAPSPPGHGNFPGEVVAVRGPYEYSVPGSTSDWLSQGEIRGRDGVEVAHD